MTKFVTVVVQPKGDNETGIECYMISDQGQALERDNVLGDSEDRKKMVLKVPKENEMVPSVLKEGNPVKEFEQDFFIVSLQHGHPKTKKNYNIMKSYDFNVPNRDRKTQRKDFRDYFKRSKSMPAQERFACFNFLLYLAEIMDLDTALSVARCVANEQPLDPALVELLESL